MNPNETPQEGEELENVEDGVDSVYVPEVEDTEEQVEEVETEEIEEEEEVTQQEVSSAITELETNLSTLPSTSSYSDIGEVAGALQHMHAVASIVVKGKLSPLKKPEDIIIAIITGKQYGFPFMSSINNIYPINGKPTMSTHLIRGLILKNRIVFKRVADYEPVYAYYKAEEKEGKIVAIFRNIVQEGKKVPIPIEISRGTKDEIPLELYVRSSQPVDYITKYIFKRKIQMPDGSWENLEVDSSYSWSDAVKAQLTKKDNWKNHPKRMLDARAFNIGAKEIADDILGGMYSLNELADTFDVNYTISDDMQETIVSK